MHALCLQVVIAAKDYPLDLFIFLCATVVEPNNKLSHFIAMGSQFQEHLAVQLSSAAV